MSSGERVQQIAKGLDELARQVHAQDLRHPPHEQRAAGVKLLTITDQHVPEMVTNLMAEVTEQRPIGLSHRKPPPLADAKAVSAA